MRYLFYAAEDFFKDDYFIQWVLNPSAETEEFWQKFIEENPQKQEEIDRAIHYIKSIRFKEITPEAEDLDRIHHHIYTKLDKRNRTLSLRRKIIYAAASFLFLAGLAITLFYLGSGNVNQQYASDYGEIKEIELPDGTLVTLNSNSSLSAFRKTNHKSREVWLKGEAFFKVSRMNGVNFVVHTDDTDIEVLGTAFNVKARNKTTQIVLNEGSVQLKAEGKKGPVLQPGDMATVSDKNLQDIRIAVVQPEQHTGWKDHFLIMEDAAVSEIIEELELVYGLQVRVMNDTLADKRLSGKFSTRNMDDLLEDMAISIGASLSKNDNTYILK